MHICDSRDLCRYFDIYLCIQYLLVSHELLHSDICHLLITGVSVNIATDILCESDGCHCKLPVSR